MKQGIKSGPRDALGYAGHLNQNGYEQTRPVVKKSKSKVISRKEGKHINNEKGEYKKSFSLLYTYVSTYEHVTMCITGVELQMYSHSSILAPNNSATFKLPNERLISFVTKDTKLLNLQIKKYTFLTIVSFLFKIQAY